MYTYKIWDGKSSINGIEAKVFRQEYNMSEGQKAYLVYKDEHLVYFQPHNPLEAGLALMGEETIEVIAAEHVKQLNEQDIQREDNASEIAMLKKQVTEMQEVINKMK